MVRGPVGKVFLLMEKSSGPLPYWAQYGTHTSKEVVR